MAVSPPPKKRIDAVVPDKAAAKQQEQKIDEIISRGGSSVKKVETQEPERIKNFNIKITAGQLAVIDQLRAQRPRKPTSPKLAISLQDWILEAIQEKVKREKKVRK